eukprot:CAMPEP_0119507868 /NCGR_PEP_ID=MMETSP1344-20130328/27644_1 /TAXON_ID=236787 /ORGANISM="Florenciella parvula, Strain CCMP2471" /LENGTH=84 /DNA_ID=CAMNT_0007544539 /DNA_START=126 /DNA_END=377 /DNA_ORIENTATION=+
MLALDGLLVALIAAAARAAWWPLVALPYPEAWDRWCYMWDDGANFVDNDLVNQPISWATLRAMLTVSKINVYEPLAWLLKALVR